MDIAALSAQDFSVLANLFLFRSAGEQTARLALSDESCTCERFERGETIYTPGGFRRSLGVLLSGSVQVSKGELIVSVLQRGDAFGAAALFNDCADYVTTLTARAPCRAVFFPQDLVQRLIQSDAAVSLGYIAYLSGRIHFLNGKIEGLIAGTAEQKLKQYLLRSMDENGCVRASATEMAKRLNLGRASLYRAFEALEAQAAIRRDGKVITVLDTEKLHEEKSL